MTLWQLKIIFHNFCQYLKNMHLEVHSKNWCFWKPSKCQWKHKEINTDSPCCSWLMLSEKTKVGQGHLAFSHPWPSPSFIFSFFCEKLLQWRIFYHTVFILYVLQMCLFLKVTWNRYIIHPEQLESNSICATYSNCQL